MAREIVVVGVSHHSAPLSLRERLAVPEDRLADELRVLMQRATLAEGLWISTCNRVEIYASAVEPTEASAIVRRRLIELSAAGTSGDGSDDVAESIYQLQGEAAVHHAFRVTSSLDSMVVGEPQILGQVKKAFAVAASSGSLGMLLDRCFTRAFGVAKRVRQETGVARGAVSISSIAGDLAQKIFGSLNGKRVLLLGAGKMGEASARKLAQTGARLVVMNRSVDRAADLVTAYGGEAKPFDQLVTELAQADIVITSTAASDFVVTLEMMQQTIRVRRHRPLFLIDIAVPRNVDPRVSSLDNVFVYDLDDLRKVADENIAARRQEAARAETLVQAEASRFHHWLEGLELTPTIVALRRQFSEVARQELQRTVARWPDMDLTRRRQLEAMCDAIVNKLLHQPLTELKRYAAEHDARPMVAALQQLFHLLPDADARALADEAKVPLASSSTVDEDETP